MRGWVMLGAALMTAGAAGAQDRPGAGYPPPGSGMAPGIPMTNGTAQHWGGAVDGHWSGGVNAPGGLSGYRQPYRGYRVPGYWVSPRFVVNDYGYYGLPRPMGGYRWARYYDDAVLIDRGGQVADYRSGVDWDGRYDTRRSSGVGGAVVGAVAGGIVGNVVAGRGDRLGGTLIGAGVGGAAGYALDRSRGRRGTRPEAYRDGYRDAPSYDDRYDRGGPGYPDGSPTWRSEDGRTTIVTSGGGYGYGSGYGASYGGGYPVVSAPYGYAGGGSVTTVTVQSAPVVTTTTTEVIEDAVTYARPAVHRVYRKRVYHRPRVRARCGCRS